MIASERFCDLSGKKSLFNITPIDNIPSILENGVLSYDKIRKMSHTTIAMAEVQKRRDSVIIPGGSRLHSYANLYFTYNNPMLYKRKGMAEDICVLALSVRVLDIENCIVSDRNAATNFVKFYPAIEGIEKLDYSIIYAQYWTHTDHYRESNQRQIKCAEVLVPDVVPPEYIKGAYVVSEASKEKMLKLGFEKKIVVNAKVFYK